jgi:hypothetical protein
MKMYISLSVVALALLLSAPLSQDASALISWTNPSGSTSDFDWSNGGSDTGLFGSPVVSGNTFIFFPSLFRANSANGVAGSAYDRLQVELFAHMNNGLGLGGKKITGFTITEFGDYGILGTGQVEVTGTMFLTNLDVFGVATSNLVSTPGSPITSGSGNWTATTSITGLDWTHVQFVLNNNLLAITGAGSTSFIEKKVNGSAIAITVVPEPATLAILGLGGLLLRRKWL